MSRVCDLCGKGKMAGNKVCFSNKKSPRKFVPNLQKETVQCDDGAKVALNVCTKCKKTLAKS